MKKMVNLLCKVVLMLVLLNGVSYVPSWVAQTAEASIYMGLDTNGDPTYIDETSACIIENSSTKIFAINYWTEANPKPRTIWFGHYVASGREYFSLSFDNYKWMSFTFNGGHPSITAKMFMAAWHYAFGYPFS